MKQENEKKPKYIGDDDTPNAFRQFHNELRKTRIPRMFWDSRKRGTYRRERLPNEIRGKLNLKRAKRERVRKMKEAQNA